MEEDSIYCSYNLSWLFWETFAKEHTLNHLKKKKNSFFWAVAMGRYIFGMSEKGLSPHLPGIALRREFSPHHPSCSVDSSLSGLQERCPLLIAPVRLNLGRSPVESAMKLKLSCCLCF